MQRHVQEIERVFKFIIRMEIRDNLSGAKHGLKSRV